jgi:hypothetical protein
LRYTDRSVDVGERARKPSTSSRGAVATALDRQSLCLIDVSAGPSLHSFEETVKMDGQAQTEEQ